MSWIRQSAPGWSVVRSLTACAIVTGVWTSAEADWKSKLFPRKGERSARVAPPESNPRPSTRDAQQSATPTIRLAAASVRQPGPAAQADQESTTGQAAAERLVPPAPGPAAGRGLTLDDLENLAIANNPTIQQAAALVEKARGQFDQAGLYPNPVVGYQASEIGNDGRAGQQGAFIGQEFVTGGKLELGQAVASNDIQRLSWHYEVQSQRVRNEVRLRYYELLGATQELSVTNQLVSVAEQGVRAAETLVRTAKTASEVDILQAEIDLNQVLITQQNADRRVKAARRRLAVTIGDPHLELGSVIGTLTGQFNERGFETEWPRLAGSPQLQAAAWRVSRACALIRREEAQPIPNVDLQVGTQYDFASQLQIANVQLGMPLPIYNRNQGNIRAAIAELMQAQEEQRRLELDLQDKLADALKRYESSRFQVQRYESEIRPKAELNLKKTTDGYEKFGQFDFVRVLIARRSYYEINLAYIRALTELRQAEVTLDGLLMSGGLDAPAE